MSASFKELHDPLSQPALSASNDHYCVGDHLWPDTAAGELLAEVQEGIVGHKERSSGQP